MTRSQTDPASPPRSPGTLRSVDQTGSGTLFRFEHTTLELRYLAGGGVFVGWDGAEPLPSYALVSEPETVPDSGTVTDRLTVDVRPDGELHFRYDGQLFRRDAAPEWSGDGWTHRTHLAADAAVLGLGGRSTAPNRRPGTYRLWNTERGGSFQAGDDPLALTMPVYYATGTTGQLTFHDNSFDGTVRIDDDVTVTMTGGPLRYYVFPGTPAQALDSYTALTGRPALPPRWALGYHQSRWGYGSQAAILAVADGFAEHELPLSGIWLDIDHLRGKQVFNVDEYRYPDLKGLADELAGRDIHLVVIVDPAIARRKDNPRYVSGQAAGAFCRDRNGRLATGVVWPGVTAYPDFTDPSARDWWSAQYAGYLDQGVAGFWHDMNEPSAFAAFGDPTLPLTTRHNLDGRPGDHREAHNVYGLLMNRAGYDGVRRHRPGERPFLISRSGWAGMQRYSGSWTGDISTSWESVRTSLAFTIGLGMCGVPYSGPDIGGFDGRPDAELYLRWLQLAAYLPFFRTHSDVTGPPREPWCFGPETLDAARAVLRERYELLPYWYTLAHQANRTGAPYVRPLLWADPADHELCDVGDAFLLGDALLVAPILEPGATERTVRLPSGRWYDRRTGLAYDGPGEVRVRAALDEGPAVLVRAGAVLPLNDERGRVRLEACRPAAGQPDGGPGGHLILDGGDGFDEPDEWHFAFRQDEQGAWTLPPAPFDVRLLPPG
ncbi:glycoside hydrolase family 31 protein [Flindersiella endophytica]